MKISLKRNKMQLNKIQEVTKNNTRREVLGALEK